MNTLERYLPLIVVLVLGGWLASKAVPPKPKNGIDYTAIGKLPLLDGGRVMPFDALARTSLQSISNLTEVKNEEGDVVASAVEWLVQVFDNPNAYEGKAADYKIFRVEHEQLLAAVELPRRPGFFRYSWKELTRNGKLEAEFKKTEAKRDAGKALNLYDAKLEDLSRKMNQFQRLIRTSGQGPNTAIRSVPPTEWNGDWKGLNQIDMEIVSSLSGEQLAPRRATFEKQLQANIEERFGPKEKWPPFALQNFSEMVELGLRRELLQEARTVRETLSPAAAHLTNIFATARMGKGEEVSKLVAEYREKYLGTVPSTDLQKANLEASFLGQLAPFYHCAFLYLPQIILASLAWMVWSQPLNRSAYWLGIFTFVVHTLCLVLRMYVQGRPPVTNLYASAVFIGWGAVGLGLLLERQYKNGVGNVVAGLCGALSLEIAHFLGGSGDTMAMLQAVLDTNFWLATHVTTVTLGYTATFVAGQIATIYLLRAVFTPSMDRENEKTLGSMMYGVLCFATLLSFVGTVLGGIWADYSWGRFWGWDPKENGAVMIVIWNALILHARWGGMVKVRGIAVLAIIGNMVTAWSWFGTNQLQIGLHSYGFDNRLAQGCMYYWLSQMAVVGIGLIPRAMWRSEWPKPTPTQPEPTPTTAANITPSAVVATAKPLPKVTGPVGKRAKTKR